MTEEILLTQQQGAVFEKLIQGKKMTEIALELNVSYSRILNILTALLVKTGMKSRSELLVNGKNIQYKIEA